MSNTDAIRTALATEYWRTPGRGYSEFHMAEAAAEAAGIRNADLQPLKQIVRRNLDPVNFVRMAEEIAEQLAGGFTVNGYRFTLCNIAHPDLPAKWEWRTPTCSSPEFFATAAEAQQSAIDHVREMRVAA